MYRPHFSVRGETHLDRDHPSLPLPPPEQNDFVAGGKNVCQNCMKMKEIRPRGTSLLPPGSATDATHRKLSSCCVIIARVSSNCVTLVSVTFILCTTSPSGWPRSKDWCWPISPVAPSTSDLPLPAVCPPRAIFLLRFIHTERKRKRNFFWMFVAYCLILFACSFIIFAFACCE